MKKRIPTLLSGALAAALVFSLGSTAMAATGDLTGRTSYNDIKVEVDGNAAIEPNVNLIASNGQEIPSSITYTDGAGGGTVYLPLRRLSRVMECVQFGYTAEDKTLHIGVYVDDDMRKLAEETLVDGKYPTNSKGETYGSDVLAGMVGQRPDLIAADATNGAKGYIRLEDEIEASEPSATKKNIPVYDLNGNVIGEFVIASHENPEEIPGVAENLAAMEAAAKAAREARERQEKAATGDLTGEVSYNGVKVELDGNVVIEPDANLTVSNGQEVPSSITYTDETGGGTVYLPLRKLLEVMGDLPFTYVAESKTLQIGG